MIYHLKGNNMELELKDIIEHTIETVKNSLENKTFEIGEFIKNFIKDEPDSYASSYLGKKIISKIIEIIENDLEELI